MREYGFPQYLNVNVLWLLPCRKCAKEFIELGCELCGEVALEVTSVTIGLHFTTQIHRTASFPIFLLHTPKPVYDMIWQLLLVRYDLVDCSLYDIYLGATHTTIPSTRGVQIPIDLVRSTTDSF